MEDEYYKTMKNLSKTKDPIDPMVKLGVVEDEYMSEDDSTDIMDRYAG